LAVAKYHGTGVIAKGMKLKPSALSVQMFKMFKIPLTIFSVAAAAASMATPLNLTGIDYAKGGNVSASLDGNGQYFFGGPQQGNYNGGAGQDFFCVDFDKHNGLPETYDATLLNQSSLTNGGLVGKIFNKFGSITSSAQGAAVQLAIWDAIYDNGDGLGAGRFQGSDYASEVSAILSADYTGVSSKISYYQPTSHGPSGNLYQGMIGAAPVPEPMSMAVVGLGAAALMRRRRKA